MKKKLKKIRSFLTGLSLIELVFSMGLAGALLVVIMQMVQMHSQTSRNAETSLQESSVSKQILTALSNADICTANLSGKMVLDSTITEIVKSASPTIVSLKPPVKAGINLGNTKTQITSMNLENPSFTIGATSGIAQLTVVFRRWDTPDAKAQVTAPTKKLKFRLQVNLNLPYANTTNIIKNCVAQNVVLDNDWTATAHQCTAVINKFITGFDASGTAICATPY